MLACYCAPPGLHSEGVRRVIKISLIYLQAHLKIFNILTAACSLENETARQARIRMDWWGEGGGGSRVLICGLAAEEAEQQTKERKKERRRGRKEGGGFNPREKLEESVSFALHHRREKLGRGSRSAKTPGPASIWLCRLC